VLGDLQTKGWEVTAATRIGNWDVRITAAKNETLDTNVSHEWGTWCESRLPYWRAMLDANGNSWDVIPYQGPYPQNYAVVDPSSGTTRVMTMKEFYDIAVNGALAVAAQRNGTPVDTSRKYRANLNVAYNFTTGKLRGLRAGGAALYRSRAMLGFPVIALTNPDGSDLPLPGLDLKNPYYGDPEYNLDLFLSYTGRRLFGGKFNYRIQLNGRGLLTGDNEFRTGKVNGRGEGTFIMIRTPRSFSAEVTLFF
jgi:hypothetical protein